MAQPQISQETVLSALSKVQDPALKRDLMALNVVRDLQIKGGEVSLRLALATPLHPFAERIENDVRAALEKAGANNVRGPYEHFVQRGE